MHAGQISTGAPNLISTCLTSEVAIYQEKSEVDRYSKVKNSFAFNDNVYEIKIWLKEIHTCYDITP